MAASTFGERLRKARMRVGIRLDDAAYLVGQATGSDISRETIRRWENGLMDESSADPIIVAGLAKVYGCRIQDLSKSVATRADRISDLLLNQKAWTGPPAARELVTVGGQW